MVKFAFRFFVCAFAMHSSSAFANAFIPTMISANALWLIALPIVVFIEGWLMAKRNWISPYRTAFISNLWSMLASLPIGFLLSWMGSMIEKLTSSDPSLRSQLTFDLAQVFYFGQLRGPDFGFVVSGTNSGIGLAALVFIGICWSVTVGVEGRYYQHINPKISRRQAIRAAVFFNVVTYCVLLVMWLPYSYYEVKSEEEFYKKVCSSSSSDSMHCDYIFNKYPEIRRQHFKDTLRSK